MVSTTNLAPRKDTTLTLSKPCKQPMPQNFKRNSRKELLWKPNTRSRLITLLPNIRETRILPTALTFLIWDHTIRKWWISTMIMLIRLICRIKKELNMKLNAMQTLLASILITIWMLIPLTSKINLLELREKLSIACLLVPTKESNPTSKPS